MRIDAENRRGLGRSNVRGRFWPRHVCRESRPMNSLFGNTPVLSPQFLPDKYRPRTWAEVIGQEKAIKQIQTIAKRSGYGGRAWWFSGKSGVGKTTIAMLIARELASDMSIVELDAGEITPAVLKDIEATMRTFGLGEKTGRAWIFNEAHGLRKDAIRKLLTLIETHPFA